MRAAKAALGLALMFGGACEAPQDELSSIDDQPRIANPHPLSKAPPIVYNSVVQIYSDSNRCSGVLVSLGRLATSKHCLRGHFSEYTVRLSRVDAAAEGEDRPVLQIRRHLDADLATVDFAGNAAQFGFAPAYIHEMVPARLNPGNRVAIAGYGRTGATSGTLAELRWGKTMFDEWVGEYTNSAGITYKPGLKFTPETSIEEADHAASYPCSGDSGGGVFQHVQNVGWGLIGVISSGTCEGTGWQQMHAADARALRSWIEGV